MFNVIEKAFYTFAFIGIVAAGILWIGQGETEILHRILIASVVSGFLGYMTGELT